MQESIHLSPCDHNKKRVIALGFFDGVHLGHQALLRRVVEVSRETGLEPAVFTFDRMPREYVTGRPVPLLTTVEERIEIIRALFPIETVIVEPFNAAMMTTSPLDFFRMLLEKHSAGWLVAGEDYTFGYKNAGRTDLLRELCRENGIGCDIITHINLAGQRISSTDIRNFLAQGDVASAQKLLGHTVPFAALRKAAENAK